MKYLRRFLRAARRSKTMWFSMLLAAFGVAQSQVDWLALYLTPKELGFTMTLLAAIVAGLRIATTASLSEKENK